MQQPQASNQISFAKTVQFVYMPAGYMEKNIKSNKLSYNQLCIMPRCFLKGGSLTPHLQIGLRGTSLSNLITEATMALQGNKARGISYSSPLCQVD